MKHEGRIEREDEQALLAVGPVDGRYRKATRRLVEYFSEYALIRARARIEIEWLIALADNPAIAAIGPFDDQVKAKLRGLITAFAVADAGRVKQLEAETNHDVKALEYFLKEKIAASGLSLPLEMIHFACTSEDISNLAYALMLKEFCTGTLLPTLARVRRTLAEMARRYKDAAMIARTHGQEASPTTIGKEFAIFAYRLERQIAQLRSQEYLGKCNGAVGNYNAHRFAYPEVDWIAHTRRFVEHLGLVFNPLTTQIESHDFVAELFHTLIRTGTILLSFARDIWGYVALGYFTQRIAPGEVGSSVMPHKVNPIDFENCEGNVGVANALFDHLASKLPVARWQRDLSDSTAMRAIGNAFGHLIIALSALERGLGKLELNEARLAASFDEEKSWEIVAEGIQTLMRRYNLDQPYERLKELTRGRMVTRQLIQEFIARLPLDDAAREAFARLEPRNYLGYASELVERFTPVED
ncbi:MAG TPA: adenylosuccinate lyase [Candidatus Binataceae bacterium]|nr:adenylosuccinate lyase [Candidatus Binataceae bacterium]